MAPRFALFHFPYPTVHPTMQRFTIQSFVVCLLFFIALSFIRAAEEAVEEKPSIAAPITVPVDGTLEELTKFVDKHNKKADSLYRVRRFDSDLIVLAEAVLAGSTEILSRPEIHVDLQNWALRKKAYAQMMLANADPPKYYGQLIAAVDEYEELPNCEVIVKKVETDILELGIILVTTLPNRDNPKPMKLNFEKFVDRLLLFLETYPERESTILVADLEKGIKAMPPVQRDRMMLVFADRLTPYFLESEDAADKKKGRELQATTRFLSLPGKPMPLEGVLSSGEAFDPDTLKGKVVLVEFWEPTCIPCRAQIPKLASLREQFGRSGFEIVGVCTKGGGKAVQDFISRTTVDGSRITWPNLVDEQAPKAGCVQLATFYNIEETPVLVLIGRDGNVVRVNPLPSALEVEIENALYPKAAADETDDP